MLFIYIKDIVLQTHIIFRSTKYSFFPTSFTLVYESEENNIITEFPNRLDNVMSYHSKPMSNPKSTTHRDN